MNSPLHGAVLVWPSTGSRFVWPGDGGVWTALLSLDCLADSVCLLCGSGLLGGRRCWDYVEALPHV